MIFRPTISSVSCRTSRPAIQYSPIGSLEPTYFYDHPETSVEIAVPGGNVSITLQEGEHDNLSHVRPGDSITILVGESEDVTHPKPHRRDGLHPAPRRLRGEVLK